MVMRQQYLIASSQRLGERRGRGKAVAWIRLGIGVPKAWLPGAQRRTELGIGKRTVLGGVLVTLLLKENTWENEPKPAT